MKLSLGLPFCLVRMLWLAFSGHVHFFVFCPLDKLSYHAEKVCVTVSMSAIFSHRTSCLLPQQDPRDRRSIERAGKMTWLVVSSWQLTGLSHGQLVRRQKKDNFGLGHGMMPNHCSSAVLRELRPTTPDPIFLRRCAREGFIWIFF